MSHNNSCSVCNVPLPSEAAVEQHLKGKKHQRKLDLVHAREDLIQRSVFLHGFRPNSLTEIQLSDFFTQTYGLVSRISFPAPNCAILEFRDKDSASKVLESAKLTVGQENVLVKARELKDRDEEQEAMNKKLACDLEELESIARVAIQQHPDFQTQLTALVEAITLTEDSKAQRLNIATEVKKALSPFLLEGFDVRLFGSSVNGLGIQGCDVDLTIKMNIFKDQDKPRMELTRTRTYLLTADPSDLMGENAINVSEWKEMNASDRVRYIGRLLNFARKQRQLPISLVKTVSNSARCPLVRFVWQGKLVCDLSVDNALGINNSRWLETLVLAEPRFRILTVLIRFWAKTHSLTGSDLHQLNSYSLTLVVSTYLMKQGVILPPVPSVEEGTEEKTICGWKCGFSAECLGRDRSSSVQELLTSFFQFFCHLKFKDSVICPKLGNMVASDQFKPDILQYAHKEFKLSQMNVQDPFVLSHNTAAKVTGKTYQKLRDCLVKASAVLTKKKPQLSLLLNLVVSPSPTLKANTSNSKNDETSAGSSSNIFPVPMKGDFRKTAQTIDDIMTEVLDMTREETMEVDEEIGGKRPRVDIFNGQYQARWRSWEGRRLKRRAVSREHTSLGGIDMEREVTRQLKEQSATAEILFSFELCAQTGEKDTVEISLIFMSGSEQDFQTFVHFMKLFMVKTVPLY